MKKRLIFLSFFACLVSEFSVGIYPTFADEDDLNWEDDDSHDRARRAMQMGEVLPVQELLSRVKDQISGEIVGIEFEHEYGRWVYELRIIDESGRLLEVYVDAETGAVLSMEKD